MTFSKFAFGLLLTAAIVGAWSYFSDASWLLIMVRLMITAVVLQLGYFGYVAISVAREAARRSKADERAAATERHTTKSELT